MAADDGVRAVVLTGAGRAFCGCDLRLAADTASFVCAFGTVALVPDTAVSSYLARELRYARAFWLAAGGRSIPAAEAYDLGLLNEVVPADDLPARAQDLARLLAAGPARALALTTRQSRAVTEVSFEAALATEARHQGDAGGHPDHVEGRTALADKRAPRWA